MAPPTHTRTARRLRHLPRVRVAGVEVRVASRYLARLLGLAGLRPEAAGGGLLLPDCRGVHTLGMRFPIDVVFLDEAGAVLRHEHRVEPGRFVCDRRAAAVLELPSRVEAQHSLGGSEHLLRLDAAAPPTGRPQEPRGWGPQMSEPEEKERRPMMPEIEDLGTVVVCEDDRVTLDLLVENLEADRYRVLAAPTAADALRSCRYGEPDLLLLDLALPDASGLDVLRRIRAAEGAAAEFDSELPVIILTGRGADAERVRGLSEGADDYLVKPFHYGELLQRIRNQLKRRSAAGRGPIRVGPLTIDGATRKVCVSGREVRLANKEFELLRTLASEPSRVFSKAELLDQIWGYRAGSRTRTVDSHASRLRRKLDPERGRFVVNCWGVGYRLVEPA